jgi:hypothetical protein
MPGMCKTGVRATQGITGSSPAPGYSIRSTLNAAGADPWPTTDTDNHHSSSILYAPPMWYDMSRARSVETHRRNSGPVPGQYRSCGASNHD